MKSIKEMEVKILPFSDALQIYNKSVGYTSKTIHGMTGKNWERLREQKLYVNAEGDTIFLVYEVRPSDIKDYWAIPKICVIFPYDELKITEDDITL